jgi:hypothetical protein
VEFLDFDEVGIARAALAHTGSMRFRHLALAEIKGAAPVRRPAAVIISDYGLGLAITKSDAIAPHGSLLAQT